MKARRSGQALVLLYEVANLDKTPTLLVRWAVLQDSQYFQDRPSLSEIEHGYGKSVHLLNNPYLFTTLAKLCEKGCRQPLINVLLDSLYRQMVSLVVGQEFPCRKVSVKTRMHDMHPEGQFEASILDENTRVVCVNLARAGTLPSQICYDSFTYILNPDGVRQDHIAINRKVNEKEQVVGCQLGSTKIGGPIDRSIVVIPDPMGATGSTIDSAMELYRPHGSATKFIAMHLIVTPEYLAHVVPKYPDLVVYAIRLDRGLSDATILQTKPGTHWKEERGLNSKQYIVPGAGGLGEVINNAYV